MFHRISSAIHHLSTSRARESANPPRLERGGTRGSTGARDHFPTILRSSIAEHPPDKRKTAARYRAEGPSPVMSKQHARLLTGSSWCKSTLGSHGCVAETDQRPVEAGKSQARYLTQPPIFTSSIGVSASTAAFHAAEAGAAPAWSANVSRLPKCKSSARRLAKAEVRGASPRGSTNVDHVVTVASRPVKAAVPVQVRLVNPISITRIR